MPRQKLLPKLAPALLALLLVLVLLALPSFLGDIRKVVWRDVDWTCMLLAVAIATLLEAGNAFCSWLALSCLGQRRHFLQILQITTAATSANSVAPVPAGLPLRAWMQQAILDVPVAVSARAMVFELFASYGVVALVAVAGLAYMGKTLAWHVPWLPALAGIAIAMLAGVLLYRRKRDLLARFARPAGEGIATTSRTMGILCAANIAVVLLSGVRLLVQIASIPGQSASLHLLFAACAALCISRMATVISLMPMGIGVREASLGASLVGLGVPLPVALFVVVTDRVVITLPYLAISLASAPLLAGKLRQRQPPRDATGDAAAPSDATQGGNRDRF